jgi:hypothetical protein
MEHIVYYGVTYEIRWAKPGSGAIFSITPHGVPFDPVAVRAAADMWRSVPANAEYIERKYHA